MSDPQKTAPGALLRRRDAFGLAAALVVFGATLGTGGASALAASARGPVQLTTAAHRPVPGLNQSRFQTSQGRSPGALGVSHH